MKMILRFAPRCTSCLTCLDVVETFSQSMKVYGCRSLSKSIKPKARTHKREDISRRCISTSSRNNTDYTTDGTSKSWVQLLYSDSDGDSNSLHQLRRRLDVALRSQRSHEKGDLLPYLVAQDLVHFYNSLTELQEKAVLFNHLAEKLGVDYTTVLSKVCKSQEFEDEGLRYGFQQSLMHSLTPTYKHLFDDISKLEYGTHFLVKMREQLLTCLRQNHLSKTPALLGFDSCLKEHIARWFANGFLDLEVVSWETSSGSLLEKIKTYEAVHVMSGWDDLKSRAGSGRRIFTFSHRLMPNEPLVILHTLLGDTIPNNIQDVLATPSRDAHALDVRTATFYSVTSTQRGLDGIGLGNLLIKRVVEKLRSEYINMTDFVTLSPVPGFRKWLDAELESIERTGVVPERLKHIFSDDGGVICFQVLKEQLDSPNWQEDPELLERLEKPMTLLCVRYLLTKRRGFVLNPVAHFHLRNGASLWRINWMGNRNSYGLKGSYGFMVNYKYDLEQLERNNDNYVQAGTVALSESVQGFVDELDGGMMMKEPRM